MVTGKELATGQFDQTTSLTADSNIVRIAGHKVSVPVRIIAKLCGVMETRVPVGYEDEGGFHYGLDMAGWFFTI